MAVIGEAQKATHRLGRICRLKMHPAHWPNINTSLTINFLRKPEACDLIGEVRLLKLGKRLAVGEVQIFSEAGQELVAHATGTYSIPS